MGTAILALLLSIGVGFGIGLFLPWMGILAGLSVSCAFIIYYLDKILKEMRKHL